MDMAPDRLSSTLLALADPTRRAILARLALGEASVKELLEPFKMSQPAISKHLKVLERAGLITCERTAQWRPRKLDGAGLKDVADWLEPYRRFWEASLDRLEDHLRTLQSKSEKEGNMANPNRSTVDMHGGEREIVITRLLDAPRELVWHAMTDAGQVVHWWGPRGFTTTIQQMDVRPGGIWQFVMHGPDGTDYPNRSVFKEVNRPERIVYAHGGGKKDAPDVHFNATWTFEALDNGDRTRLTIRMVFDSESDREMIVRDYGAIEGGEQTLERLSTHLPEMGLAVRELTITRIVDAPRMLVFQAWTEPSQMAQWWGPHGFSNPVCELDVKPGGVLAYRHAIARRLEYPCNGNYLEIVRPERLVFTSRATDEAGRVILDGLTTVTFTEYGGKTQLVLWTRMAALARHAVSMLEGMQAGWTQSLERLDATMAR